jgi:hypothetical protein
MRHPRLNHLVLIYAALFAVAYAGFFAYSQYKYKASANHNSVSVNQPAPIANAARTNNRWSLQVSSSSNSTATSLAPANTQVAAQPPNSSTHTNATTETPSPESYVSVAIDSAEATGAADENARAIAIRQLAATRSSESLAALKQSMQSDEIARNRLLAVNSLRQLGLQGDSDGSVRALLRVAMSDRDANVAANAQDAYEEINKLSQ